MGKKVGFQDADEDSGNGKSTFWSKLSDFLDETSMHGAKYTKEGSLFKRIAWAMIIIAMGIGVLYLVISITIKLIDVKFSTRLIAETAATLTFPAITLCPANAIRKSYLQKHPTYRPLLYDLFGREPAFKSLLYENAEQERQLANVSTEDVNITQMFIEGAHQLEGMIIVAVVPPNIDLHNSFSPVMTDISLCYQMHTNVTVQRSGKDGGMYLMLNALQDEYVLPIIADGLAGYMISIHDPRDAPCMGERGVVVTPGSNVFISITKSVQEYMEGFGCVTNDSYSRHRCMEECSLSFVAKACGCRLYNWNVDAARVCRSVEDVWCIGSTFAENYTAEVAAECDCPHRCEEESYSIQMSSAPFPAPTLLEIAKESYDKWGIAIEDITVIRLYYKDRTVLRIQQVRAYSWGDFWGDLGGFMGLCLGASIMTLIELVDFIIRAVFRCISVSNAHPMKRATQEKTENLKNTQENHPHLAWTDYTNYGFKK